MISSYDNIANRLLALVLALGFVGFVAALSGCAPTLVTPTVSEEEARAEAERQRELAFSVRVKRSERLLNMGLPLLVTSSSLCGEKVHMIYGFLLHDRELYGNKYKDVAARYFDMGDGVYVRYVHPYLPGAGAGLRAGDRVVSVYGRPVGESRSRFIMERIEDEDGDTIMLEVERGGRTLELAIEGVEACNYGLVMVSDDSVNAFADGNNVAITTGMMRFVESDEELAVVMGHEISHNALGHLDKKSGNVLLGTLLDLLIYGTTGVDTGGTFGKIGGLVYSQAFEAEADYAGLHIAAEAGFGISGAPYLWRRMAVEHPAAIEDRGFLATHPSTPKRFLALEQTINEIQDKQSRGVPLFPLELKGEGGKERGR